jgi:hypothetical protein
MLESGGWYLLFSYHSTNTGTGTTNHLLCHTSNTDRRPNNNNNSGMIDSRSDEGAATIKSYW